MHYRVPMPYDALVKLLRAVVYAEDLQDNVTIKEGWDTTKVQIKKMGTSELVFKHKSDPTYTEFELIEKNIAWAHKKSWENVERKLKKTVEQYGGEEVAF